jgi:hypothetical protein
MSALFAASTCLVHGLYNKLLGGSPRHLAIIAAKATRTTWKPIAVRDESHRIRLFDEPVFGGDAPVLAAAFYVRDVEYRRERGTHHRLQR